MRRIGLAAMAAALLASACAGGSTDGASAPLEAGRIIPGSVERFEQALNEHRGRPLVVNFWATWCEPCKREMPLLVAAFNTYRDDGVAFFGVDVQDDRAAALLFIGSHEVPFGHMSDADRSIQRDQDIFGLPATHFYSPSGELVSVFNGEITEEDLKREIDELLRLD